MTIFDLDKAQPKRIESIEIAKGIAIICIVIGHSGSFLSDFVYLFNVAFFFFIAGYLFKEQYMRQPIKFIIRRIKSLYIPFVFFCLIFLLLHSFFIQIGFYSQVNLATGESAYYTAQQYPSLLLNIFTFGNTEQLLLPFWFLTSLFIVNVLFSLITFISYKLKDTENSYLIHTIVWILLILGFVLDSRKIYFYRQIDISLITLFIFYLGFFYKKIEKIIPHTIYLTAFSFVLLGINSFRGKIDVISHLYVSPEFYIFNAVLGAYCILFFSQFISTKKTIIKKVLTVVGNNSFQILALHVVSFKLVSFIIIKRYNLPYYHLADFPTILIGGNWWIIYTIAGVVLPLLVVGFSKPFIERLTHFFRKDLNTFRIAVSSISL